MSGAEVTDVFLMNPLVFFSRGGGFTRGCAQLCPSPSTRGVPQEHVQVALGGRP